MRGLTSKSTEEFLNSKMEYIIQCLENKNFNEAVRTLKRIVKRYPENVEALSTLGVTYFIMGNMRQAKEVLRNVLKIDPEDPWAHYILGMIHLKNEKWNFAIDELEKAIKYYPENSKNEISDAYLNLGLAYWEVERKDEALEAWRTSLKYNPEQESAERYLKEFTNEYGMPKSENPLMDDTFAFIEIKRKEYLELKNRDEFDDLEEANRFLKKLMEVWNNEVIKYDLDHMSTQEKIELFKRIKID